MTTASQQSPLVTQLPDRFGDQILGTRVFKDEVTHLVQRDALVPVCRFVRDEPEMQMDYLVDVIGVDLLTETPRFEVVYHLYSIAHHHRLRLKVKLEDGQSIPSVTGIWPAADWPEREAYDMYGIRFEGHPNLKRIYMAPDWEGFPMRKDYPLKGYRDNYNPFGEEREEDF